LGETYIEDAGFTCCDEITEIELIKVSTAQINRAYAEFCEIGRMIDETDFKNFSGEMYDHVIRASRWLELTLCVPEVGPALALAHHVTGDASGALYVTCDLPRQRGGCFWRQYEENKKQVLDGWMNEMGGYGTFCKPEQELVFMKRPFRLPGL
jgi:hypothetical protein